VTLGVTAIVPNLRLVLCVPCVAVALVACQAAQQRKAAEKAEINRQAGEEIGRICALHGAEREEELKKLKKASGMDLYCPNP
jgi:hypothetical protein